MTHATTARCLTGPAHTGSTWRSPGTRTLATTREVTLIAQVAVRHGQVDVPDLARRLSMHTDTVEHGLRMLATLGVTRRAGDGWSLLVGAAELDATLHAVTNAMGAAAAVKRTGTPGRRRVRG
jgi:hypothetical protein